MSDRPNILLFTTDQHRGDCLGLAGHPLVETPNVDSFIKRGAYFPHAYTEIPSTTGARRVLHGGQANHRCGLIGYGATEWLEHHTLAQTLADAGYHCLNVGWRNMHPRRKLYGFHQLVIHELRDGEDDYLDWLRERLGPEAWERSHGADANGWVGRPWPHEERFHATNWTIDETGKMIRHRDPTRPFFMWCSHLRPHSPFDPPQYFWDMYIDREMPPPPIGDWAERHHDRQPGLDRRAWCGELTPPQLQRARAGYYGNITHIDYQLGVLMERLYAELDNCLIVFCADHGDMMGDHYLMRKCYGYEGSARIPMVIRYPNGSDLPTGTFEQPVGLQDVMPTILDVAGVPVPETVTGSSMLGAIRGEPWREFVHGEHSPCYALEHGMHYLTDARIKYIWYVITGEEQLFDLTSDPTECHDLARDPAHREQLELWRNRLVALLHERGDGFSDGTQLIGRNAWYGPHAGQES